MYVDERDVAKIIIPKMSDDLTVYPNYAKFNGAGTWCYDCVAQQYAEWVCIIN